MCEFVSCLQLRELWFSDVFMYMYIVPGAGTVHVNMYNVCGCAKHATCM